MAITSTRVLRFIERKLGYKFHQLELDSDEIMETILEESLVTFSNYYPHYQQIMVVPSADTVQGREGVYHIKTDLDVLGVANVYLDGISSPSPVPMNTSQNPIDMKASADLHSMVTNPTTFQWEPPNKLQIFPKYVGLTPFAVKLRAVHPEHLRTIPLSLRDEFYKLALYDVQDSIYRIRRHFDSINTTFTNIELFMSDLEQANDKREELLERWRSDQLKMFNRKKLYIY